MLYSTNIRYILSFKKVNLFDLIYRCASLARSLRPATLSQKEEIMQLLNSYIFFIFGHDTGNIKKKKTIEIKKRVRAASLYPFYSFY